MEAKQLILILRALVTLLELSSGADRPYVRDLTTELVIELNRLEKMADFTTALDRPGIE